MYTALSTRQLQTFSSFFNPSLCPTKAHQPTSFSVRLAKKSQHVGSKMLRRQQKASSRNFPARAAHTYCHKQRPTGRRKTTQVCTCLRVCSIHCTHQCTPREKRKISQASPFSYLKECYLQDSTVIGHQYQILITKHAMSDTASYENSHHTLKKEERGGKGGRRKKVGACFSSYVQLAS